MERPVTFDNVIIAGDSDNVPKARTLTTFRVDVAADLDNANVGMLQPIPTMSNVMITCRNLKVETLTTSGVRILAPC